jgi:hypothetical protein
MGHGHPVTTQLYTDEVRLDELADVLGSGGPRAETHKRREI